jgi:hypothetical protein
VSLDHPVGGEITGLGQTYLVNTAPPDLLIPFGSSWRYLDDGSNQGTAWRTPGFSDANWSNNIAQLGFGDSDEATPIRRTNTTGTIATFYFRKSIQVPDPTQYGTFSLQLLRDDAGIVYFNGREVYRSPNMPAGEVPYNMYTGGTAPPDNFIDSTNIFNTGSLLISGPNLVAVELHQQSSTSSDASFDLSLSASPRDRLSYAIFGDQLVLYWSDPSFLLEASDSLPGTWKQVGAPSPAAVPLTAPQTFYRLKRP